MDVKLETRSKTRERKRFALRGLEDTTEECRVIENYTDVKTDNNEKEKYSPLNHSSEKKFFSSKSSSSRNIEDQKVKKKTKEEVDETLADVSISVSKPKDMTPNPLFIHNFPEKVPLTVNSVDPILFNALRHALKCPASSSDQCGVNKCTVAKNFLFRGLIHADICEIKCDFLLCKNMKSILQHVRFCKNNNYICKTKQFVLKLCEFHQNTCVNQPCDIELCKDIGVSPVESFTQSSSSYGGLPTCVPVNNSQWSNCALPTFSNPQFSHVMGNLPLYPTEYTLNMQSNDSNMIYPGMSTNQMSYNLWSHRESEYRNDMSRLNLNVAHDAFMLREDVYANSNINDNSSRNVEESNYTMAANFADMQEIYFGQSNKRVFSEQPRLEMSEWAKINFMKKEETQKELVVTSGIADQEENKKQFNIVRPTSIPPIEIYKNWLQTPRPFL
ncbi:uncharacterized protein LOC101234712 [Hydra vulgaris]|uniref:uncharacterized protein LOC101234712 n=1 Tax=Hydra vulgaris TaxID=6087 RepID=UPI001F5F4E23|nr:uncharacterized protein LOC101234712 [Hydra vulgaris]